MASISFTRARAPATSLRGFSRRLRPAGAMTTLDLFTPISRQPMFTPARPTTTTQTPLAAPLFAFDDEPAAPEPAPPALPPPPAPEAPPSFVLPLKFARALQSFTADLQLASAEGAGTADLFMRLLSNYEHCCEEELKRLKAELQRSDQSSSAALAAECELLRGERNSWNLLRWLYHDWAERQQLPPPFPEAPEDWGASLRQLGPVAPPLLDEQTGLPDAATIAASSSSSEGGRALSKTAADAGVAVRPLHDEAAQEEAIVLADPVLDLGQRCVRWLEGVAYTERLVQGDVMVQERNPLARTLASLSAGRTRTEPDAEMCVYELPAPMEGLGVPDPDAGFGVGRRLDPHDEAQHAIFLRDLWKFVRAGRLADAREFCRSCNLWWRAVTLGGAEPWRWDAEAAKWAGNPDRALWRKACVAIAQRATSEAAARPGAEYEAAIYAALSCDRGMLAALERVGEGWEDALWANMSLSLSEQLAAQQAHVNAGEGARPTSRDLLVTLLDYAASAPRPLASAAEGEGERRHAAARHHAAQRALVLLRLAQLPGHATPDALVAALQPLLAVAPQWEALFARTGRAAPWPADTAAAAAAANAIANADAPGAELLEGGGGGGGGGARLSRRGEAHVLRFVAHASLFLYHATLPRAATEAQLPCHAQWQRLLRTYIEHLCESAGRAPATPAGLPFAAPTFGPTEPALAQMAGVAALLASSVRPDAAIVASVGSFFGQLPADLEAAQIRACLDEVAQQLRGGGEHLLPEIVLHALLAKQAQPLPSAAAPPAAPPPGGGLDGFGATAADAGASSRLANDAGGRLQAALWLEASEDDAGDADAGGGGGGGGHYLHQALAYAVCLLRRVVVAAGYTAGALLPPGAGRASASQLASPPVASGVFVAVAQAEDGAALLALEGEDASGAGQFFRATPLQHGGVARLPLPLRARMSLLEEGDGLVFFLEEARRLDPPVTAWWQSLQSAAQAADAAGRVTHGPSLAPNLAVLYELHDRYCRAAHADGGRGASARLAPLDCELRFWVMLVRSEDEYVSWRRQLGARPIADDGAGAAFASQTLRQAAAETRRAMWRRALTARAKSLHEAVEAALTVREGEMGPLPTSAEVRALYPDAADADAAAAAPRDELPEEEATIAGWPSAAGSAAAAAAAAGAGASVGAGLGGGGDRVPLRSAEGLRAVRARLVPRLLRTLHEVLLETARQIRDADAALSADLLRRSLYVADLLADERYQLYTYFDKEGLKQMLQLFRLSALEMLGSGHAG